MNPETVAKHEKLENLKRVTRRHFFEEALGVAGLGIGAAALATVLPPKAFAQQAAHSLGKHPLDFAPKAKAVIYLQQAGGVPHVDMWDYKPLLKEMDGKPIPEASVVEGYGGRIAFLPMIPGVSTSDIISHIRRAT